MLGRKLTGNFALGQKSKNVPKLGEKMKSVNVVQQDQGGAFLMNHHFEDNQTPHHKQGSLEKHHRR